jgi:hypothetical protein
LENLTGELLAHETIDGKTFLRLLGRELPESQGEGNPDGSGSPATPELVLPQQKQPPM